MTAESHSPHRRSAGHRDEENADKENGSSGAPIEDRRTPDGPQDTRAERDRRTFEMLLLDYEMGREDERVNINLTVALVGTIAALLAGIVAVVTGDVHFKEDGYALPELVSAFTPLLPLALAALVTMIGTSGTLKSFYLRQVEAALRKLAGSPLPDHQGVLFPSGVELNQAAISPVRGRRGYRILLLLLVSVTFVTYIGIVYLLSLTVDDTFVRLLMGAAYGGIATFFLVETVGVTVRGRSLLHSASRQMVRTTMYPESTVPRRTATTVSNGTERSLVGYLLLPRPEDAVKWLFVPATFGLCLLLRDESPRYSLGGAAVAWLAFEYLTYQARYQWNDVRGYSSDRAHPFSRPRARLPRTGRGDRFSLVASFLVVLVRLTAVGVLVLLDVFGTATALGLASVSALIVAVVYEALRSGDPRASSARSNAVVLVAGGGYAVRAGLGIALAADSALPAVSMVLLLSGAWAFGIVFVAMTWALEGFAHLTSEDDGSFTVALTPSGVRLGVKPHLVLLARQSGRPIRGQPVGAIRGSTDAVPTGSHVRGLERTTSLGAAWNVALLIAVPTSILGCLTGGPIPWSPIGVLVVCGSAVIGVSVGVRASSVTWSALALAGGGVLTVAIVGTRSLGLAGAVGLVWLVMAGCYLGFRRSTYADLKSMPLVIAVAADKSMSALAGSGWSYLRPRSLTRLLAARMRDGARRP